MAASKETRESPNLKAKMGIGKCSENEINSCQAKRSKELLVIEHNAVSKDDHIAKLFAKQPAQGGNKPRQIQRLPPNLVLSQVMSFLPQMKKANDEINAAIASGADPASFDIANVDESEQFIEMNLALVEDEGDSAMESDCESEDDSSDSELEHDGILHRPRSKQVRNIIEEIDSSRPADSK